MGNYDYKKGKKFIIDVLNSKTKIITNKIIPNDNAFTYQNGVISLTSALFLDIRNSTKYFKNNKRDITARIMRAFFHEIITILNQNKNYRQIGIRGDCVYSIYSTVQQKDFSSVLNDAIMINTFQDMFQKILSKYKMPQFKVGIGLGASEDLVIKAGVKGTGIRDYIWIGDSVIDASKLSSLGNKNGYKTIVMDSYFFDKISNSHYQNKLFKNFFTPKNNSFFKDKIYEGAVSNDKFGKWIKEGMKNNG